MRKLTHQQLLDRQQKRQKTFDPKKFCVVLDNIRSALNVGSIFRTADGLGIEKLWLCGITAAPPNPQIKKTALDAQDSVPWEYRKDLRETVLHLKNSGYKIVALEQLEASQMLSEAEFDQPICLIVGNEVEGVSEEIFGLVDEAVEINMVGVKNSFNVAVAFGIASFFIFNKIS